MSSTIAESRWADNDGVRIHYLDSVAGGDSAAAPLIFVPGFGEEAMEHLPFIEAQHERRCIVVDLRGRGKSDIPESGYGIEEHASDLDAVIRALGLPRLHLVSYSRGTVYAMRWATRNPERVKSYVIGDYGAAQVVPPGWFPAKAEKSRWRGRPVSDRMPAPAIRRLFAAAVKLDMWEALRRLSCPILVIHGTAAGALLNEAVLGRYRAAVKDLRVEAFEGSSHDLWSPDPLRFARTVAEFIRNVDTAGS